MVHIVVAHSVASNLDEEDFTRRLGEKAPGVFARSLPSGTSSREVLTVEARPLRCGPSGDTEADVVLFMRGTTGPYRVSWGPMLEEIHTQTRAFLGPDGKFRVPVLLFLSQINSGYSGPITRPLNQDDAQAFDALEGEGLIFRHVVHRMNSKYSFSAPRESGTPILNPEALVALLNAVVTCGLRKHAQEGKTNSTGAAQPKKQARTTSIAVAFSIESGVSTRDFWTHLRKRVAAASEGKVEVLPQSLTKAADTAHAVVLIRRIPSSGRVACLLEKVDMTTRPLLRGTRLRIPVFLILIVQQQAAGAATFSLSRRADVVALEELVHAGVTPIYIPVPGATAPLTGDNAREALAEVAAAILASVGAGAGAGPGPGPEPVVGVGAN